MLLGDKDIILGVTGGIGAYKALELTRQLKKEGARVWPVMTNSACEFIRPLSLATLAGNPVLTSLFDLSTAGRINHIELAQKADLMIIAPATANTIARIALGIADDMLSTIVLATKAPLLIAPAMNNVMFDNPMVQANIERLRKVGYGLVGPEHGELACGQEGRGRLASLEEIIDAAQAVISKKDFAGQKVLVTAGATREPIDPVRFISNASSGKMGYALARCARRRGAEVVLVSGPATLSPPPGVTVISAVSAQEMHEEAMKHFAQSTIVIMAAAVSDYKPVDTFDRKIKKKEGRINIEMERTIDILKLMGEKKDNRTLVGFALETNDILINAMKKLEEKNLDIVVANSESAMSSEVNQVRLITHSGEPETTEKLDKGLIAELILDKIALLRGL